MTVWVVAARAIRLTFVCWSKQLEFNELELEIDKSESGLGFKLGSNLVAARRSMDAWLLLRRRVSNSMRHRLSLRPRRIDNGECVGLGSAECALFTLLHLSLHGSGDGVVGDRRERDGIGDVSDDFGNAEAKISASKTSASSTYTVLSSSPPSL